MARCARTCSSRSTTRVRDDDRVRLADDVRERWLRRGAGGGLAGALGPHPDTLYHYRLTATNNSDTSGGADRSFRTDILPPGGGGPSAATPPAKASFAGSKSTITVNRKRRFKFSFRATPGLKGTVVFKSAKKVRVSREKKVTLASKSFTVPTSGKVTLRIRLSKKSLRILKLNRRIRVRVTATLKNAAGLTSTANKKITLKAPK